LQLQNNSALGGEVNPEGYLCTLLRNFKKNGCLTLEMILYIDKYIINYVVYRTVESNLRTS